MVQELYSRQQELQLDVPDAVTIAGVGGIGSWVAIFCAMSGVRNLYLYDPDVMEESNRNRLPFCQGSLNRYKTEVVRDYCSALRPDAIIVAFNTKLEGNILDTQIRISNWVVECTDSPKSQHEIYRRCLSHNRSFVRGGYDGTHITVTSVVGGWIDTDEEEATYTVNPSWVVPSVMCASMVVYKMMKSREQEVNLDIGEIGIPLLQKKKRLTKSCNSGRTRNIRWR